MKLIIKIILGAVILGIITITTISLLDLTKKSYQKNLVKLEENHDLAETNLINDEDLNTLPIQVKNYLNYVGVTGHEKVHHFKSELSIEMKTSQDGSFIKGDAIQTNYLIPSTRLFYMKLKMKGLKVVGIHHFENGKASMKIKLLDVFPIVNVSGEAMNKAETVTIFNDMCLFVPGSLIDDRITWEEIDDYNVIGTFTNEGITISAKLTFDEEYKLINFYSEDRYYSANDGSMQQVPWSTPITEYKLSNGLNLPYKGSAIWHFEAGDYTYIKMYIKNTLINE